MGDETKIMSELPDPIPGPQLSNTTNNSGTQGGNSGTQGGNSGMPGLPSNTTNNNQFSNNNTGLPTTAEDDEFYSALKGLQLSNNTNPTPENPTEPVGDSKNFKKQSSFISGTGLIGTGLDNQPSEEQQKPSKLKSNFDYGLPEPNIPTTNPFDTNANSQAGNQGLISDLNLGQKSVITNPDAVNFGNTDFTNSGFGSQNPSNHVAFDSKPQLIPGGSINPSNVDMSKKHHSEQPKEFTQNPIGDYGQAFPKAPEFNLGGTYDWNYYPKLISSDLDGKLAILRKVGP